MFLSHALLLHYPIRVRSFGVAGVRYYWQNVVVRHRPANHKDTLKGHLSLDLRLRTEIVTRQVLHTRSHILIVNRPANPYNTTIYRPDPIGIFYNVSVSVLNYYNIQWSIAIVYFHATTSTCVPHYNGKLSVCASLPSWNDDNPLRNLI